MRSASRVNGVISMGGMGAELGQDVPQGRAWVPVPGGIAAPCGFWADGVKAEVKYPDKYDVALLYSSRPAQTAGVFTRNLVKAHPLVLNQRHLANGVAQAVVMNSGNANACVGEAGDWAALAMARLTAEALEIGVDDVLVASTGVIGVEMPMDRVAAGIEKAAAEVRVLRESGPALAPEERSGEASDSEGRNEEASNPARRNREASDSEKKVEGAHRAALAIMTTDTVAKELAWEFPCRGGTIRLGGMAKGSGMIHPNMGTMLGFLTTDAEIPAAELQRLLREAVDESFNMVTVDGDTSTNDMVLFLANGASGLAPVAEDWDGFARMVKAMCRELAQAIARDGEGASKFLEVRVLGAKTREDARKIAKSVCASSLVKTAMFGEDANWGRILCAAGYAGASFNPAKADILIGNLPMALAGQGLAFSEEEAKEILRAKDIRITVNLHGGVEEATAWGCDLTHDYVTINGDYRT
ncbi:glutamate N-acetyltransferase [Acididesulfobacillus acetoxydans]|uniref:Arginine biosynthesis bifunctional protein ArgJ n=3 Tax=Eubacteriales TaxID=186802 RepID=A0A8S0XAR5_9FIRM|nr:glutamate N-acetyltransferase [Acididesulfobacillus acetoxydans]CEJ09654.1 Arginine biosynthesis bifunctional protein ArgJ [Acididesulfobacillus acetoxydans]